MNDMVSNSLFFGKDASTLRSLRDGGGFYGVPFLPGSDMCQRLSIFPVKNAARYALLPRHSKAAAGHALAAPKQSGGGLHRLPILSGSEVFYRVPIFINRRKRKNPTETLNLL